MSQSQTRKFYPIGTVCNGWKLVKVRKDHRCHECGDIIRARRAAWSRSVRLKSPDKDYIGQACQWRVGDESELYAASLAFQRGER